jgi:NitT/TauT family transport system permease protein
MREPGSALPVAAIAALILAVWYAACLPMNNDLPQLQNAGDVGLSQRYAIAWGLERPVLPAPHQIIADLYASTIDTTLIRQTADGWMLSPRNLITHAWTTLSATLLGFVMGAVLGVALAAAIIHSRVLQKSLMPWVIASQTIPILAIAPIIIVALGSIGLTGLLPKAIISMYLCFFPVTIGMVKGFTSPDAVQLDLMRTYNASANETFWKLRWPAALPYLFAGLKVAISISLVGLSGSYFGQTLQIWSALVMAALMAALLVGAVALAERLTQQAMGAKA